jgi:hypothetical protein
MENQNKYEVASPFAGQVVEPRPQQSGLVEVEQQRAVAEVQAAMMVAKRFPRNQIDAMDKILLACTRQSLAEAALYSYQRGGTDISGPSIKLAEVLAQGWGNIACGVTELSRRNGMSECMAYAWDMESNFRDEKRFQVRHWRDTKKGGYQLSDERDIYELIANMGSRRKRACILAVVPGDVAEAATKQCEETLKAKADTSPDAVKKMVGAFKAFGVTEKQIEARIQRRLDAITPAQIVNLRKVYNSLKDGMSSAADWFEVEQAPEPEGKTATDRLANKLKAARNKPAEGPEVGPGRAKWEAAAMMEPALAAEVLGALTPADEAEWAALAETLVARIDDKNAEAIG